MTITGGFVLFAVIWFLGLLVALPIGLQTQTEGGEVVPGTPGSAPNNPQIKRKMKWVTAVTIILWVPLVALIASGWVSIDDVDIWKNYRPH